MEYLSEYNLLLEALAYLGRRAAGYTTGWLLNRLRSRGVDNLAELEPLLCPIGELMTRLDEAIAIEEARLHDLFGNLPGFPYNSIGSYSPGFLLLFPLVADGDLSERPKERLAGDLAMMLDIAEETTGQREMSGEELSARVLAMSIPAQSKVAILELYHRPQPVLEQALALVNRVTAQLKKHRPLMERCAVPFTKALEESGPDALVSRTSALRGDGKGPQQLRPFLFGMDTLLASPTQIYCGILRLQLQAALDSARSPEYNVYRAIKLLADQTRFEILCYLRDHNAYGQELAQKFGLSRNTIHHHMTKLLDAHLVKCTVDGNRTYYTADPETIAELLDRQRELLLPGE